MIRFTLHPDHWYAMELFGPEFGAEVRHCSPILVHSLRPGGGGKRCFELAFYHSPYAAGVRDKVYSVETLERSEHFLLARVLGTERLVLLMELTDEWLNKNFEHSIRSEPRRKEEPLTVPSGFGLKEIYDPSKKEAFGDLNWNAETMAGFGLPNIAYPVPYAGIKAAIGGQLKVGFEELLYWLQLYTEFNDVRWRDYLTAMARLADLITDEPAIDLVVIEGERFWLELGEVNLLSGDIVTIQRDHELVGAFQSREDGTLRFAAYQPLDAKATRYATGLARKPSADGTVCMRPNNWEYALDSSAGFGQFYAADSGACHLSRWEFGLGISADGSRVEGWYAQRARCPVEPRFTATQVEVFLEFRDLIDV